MVKERDDLHNLSLPGVVHIALKEGFPAEVLAAAFSDAPQAGEPNEFRAALNNIKNEHGLLHFEPSFSFTPPGLPPEESPPPGRDRYFTLYFPPQENVRNIVEKFSQLKEIEFAVPARRIVPPNDPTREPLVIGPSRGYKSQWYIPRCGVDCAWRLKGGGEFFSGQGVVVADIDWGFRTTHQEFFDRIERKYNSINGSDFVSDGDRISHGTATLGIIGASRNGSGMVGIAYGASLWAIQAGDGIPHTTDFRHWWFAIDYVRRTSSSGRRKVICLEAQTTDKLNIETDLLVNKAIRDAIASQVVVCVPAGNGNKDAGLDRQGNPFCQTGSILVGATVFDDDPGLNKKAELSNWGDRVVISAPGDERNDVTCSADADDRYVNDFGRTSGATPKVAGTVALILEATVNLSHGEIRRILNDTGRWVTSPDSKPVGTFLNACGAVQRSQLPNDKI